MRCLVPALMCSAGFAPFVLPVLTDDPNAIDKIARMKAPVKIIFIETNFHINYKPNDCDTSTLIIVKPCELSMYAVREVRGVPEELSPFAEEQIMSGETLAFCISFCIEAAEKFSKKTIRDRRIALSELCKKQKKKAD